MKMTLILVAKTFRENFNLIIKNNKFFVSLQAHHQQVQTFQLIAVVAAKVKIQLMELSRKQTQTMPNLMAILLLTLKMKS